MKDWRQVLVAPETTIRDTIKVIDAGALQIALVVDGDTRLLGTVTDGDIRRGILRGVSLDDTVRQIMNSSPCVARTNDSQESILALMHNHSLLQIPVLDEAGQVVSLEVLEHVLKQKVRTNTVVIMAGGMGTRLRPLTDDCPKPLLKVGSKPVLETILESFREYGFRKFAISVRYKAEMIEAYFGDGSRWGVEISYLHEAERKGTAGALGLLRGQLSEPFFVMNGDVLTKVNFHHVLDFHSSHRAQATMCVRDYDFQIPYGVVTVRDSRLTAIKEKPVQHFFVSAGIYLLEPEVLELIPETAPYDMPNFFETMITGGLNVVGFPLREYWLDIGMMDDYERANYDYQQVFA